MQFLLTYNYREAELVTIDVAYFISFSKLIKTLIKYYYLVKIKNDKDPSINKRMWLNNNNIKHHQGEMIMP